MAQRTCMAADAAPWSKHHLSEGAHVSHLREGAHLSHLMNADLPESVTSACQFSGVSSRVAEAVATDAKRQTRASM